MKEKDFSFLLEAEKAIRSSSFHFRTPGINKSLVPASPFSSASCRINQMMGVKEKIASPSTRWKNGKKSVDRDISIPTVGAEMTYVPFSCVTL